MERIHLTHALFALALVLGAGEARAQPTQPVPPELDESPLTGAPPASGYQGAEDLERTRNEVYGQILTTSQHAEIASWRPASPGWWRDPVRNDRTLEVRAAMAETLLYLPDPNDPTVADGAMRDDDGLFGFDVSLRYDTSGGSGGDDDSNFGGPSVVGYSVTYDAATRPDLYLFYEALAGLLGSIRSDNGFDNQIGTHAFLTLFPHLAELDRRTVDEMVVMFWKAVDDYRTELFFDVRLSAQRYYQPIAEGFAADGFASYDLDDAAFHRREIAKREAEAYERTGQAFLDSLPDDLGKYLANFVVRNYIPTLKTTVIYASRSVELARIDDLRREASAP